MERRTRFAGVEPSSALALPDFLALPLPDLEDLAAFSFALGLALAFGGAFKHRALLKSVFKLTSVLVQETNALISLVLSSLSQAFNKNM